MLDRYGLDVGIFALWYAYLCITWNIVGGFAGEFTFAHPVYVAIGGYTSAVLLAHWHISPWLGVLAGAALAALLAAALSWINFRQRLPHLTYALITLAITFIVVVTLRSLDVLGASEGLFIQRGHDLHFMFQDKASYYCIINAVAWSWPSPSGYSRAAWVCTLSQCGTTRTPLPCSALTR
jgi:branched-chain amino acid transport system permease protein